MADNKYAKHLIQNGLVGDNEETSMFNAGMDYILNNIEMPEPDLVRAAFMKAPPEILEYFAQDKWFKCATSPKDVPIYSVIAQEILLERIVLGGAERK